MATPVQVVIDCADPARMAAFWAIALGYSAEPPPEGFVTWEDWLRAHDIPESDWNSAGSVVDPDGIGPRIYFQRVPERKSVKNRVHLDVAAGGPRGTPPQERWPRAVEHARTLVEAGATILREMEELGSRWVVMQDPEGNEFCVQ